MNPKLRIIQVGAGAWGLTWYQIIGESSDWECVAVVDVDDVMRRRIQEYYAIPRNKLFRRLLDALQSIEADAALVVVPPEYHADVCAEVLEHQLHCLVEKPLAETMWDARRIVAAGMRAERKVMVSQNYRFRQAPQTVRRLILRSCVGKLGSVFINFQ
jgi:predicted dehydrogenase